LKSEYYITYKSEEHISSCVAWLYKFGC